MPPFSEDDVAVQIPAALIAPLTRMGERVAALEARATTEIASLKRDTEVIRAAIHDINNNQQRFVAAEQQCASGLALLTEKMAGHTDQIAAIATSIHEFATARSRAEGAWWATGKIAIVASTCLSGLAAAVTATLWALNHLSIHP